jgi:hypothetical protein
MARNHTLQREAVLSRLTPAELRVLSATRRAGAAELQQILSCAASGVAGSARNGDAPLMMQLCSLPLVPCQPVATDTS